MMFDQQFQELLVFVAIGIAVILLAKQRDKRLGGQRPETQTPESPSGVSQHAPPAVLRKRPVLRGVSGFYAGAVIPFDDTAWVLGSDSNVSNLVFPGNVPGIAKRHCLLRYEAAGDVVLLEDTWSETGTWLADGTRLTPGVAHRLAPGAQFYLATPDQMFTIAAAA